MIRLGYACQSMGLGISASRTITLTNYRKLAQKDKWLTLYALYERNLSELLDILKYNVSNGIYVFRVTSKLFPIANLRGDIFYHFVKNNPHLFSDIKEYIEEHKLRVSFHPDQFLVLNTPHRDVFDNTMIDLKLHAQTCVLLGIADNPCIVLHVGGVYNDKPLATARFKRRLRYMDSSIRSMLMIENDDKSYDLDETLEICQTLNLPMVLDVHHAWCTQKDPLKLLSTDGVIDFSFITEQNLLDVKNTWDGKTPKFHFSSRASDRTFRSHSAFIDARDFITFTSKLTFDVDIMLECKSKDTALKKLRSELPK